MSRQAENDGPIVKIDSDRESPDSSHFPYSGPPSTSSPHPSTGNVFTSFIKKAAPYNQISPALKRRAAAKKESAEQDPNKRSAVSQIFHSVPDAVKKKFSRGGTASPETNRWESDEEDSTQHQRPGQFRSVLDQIDSADTPLLRRSQEEAPIMASDIDHFQVESDDENTDHDGLLSSLFNQLTTIPAVDIEIKKVKSEIEVTQRNNTELTKKYLETVSDSQLPDLQTRESYNQRNLKSQKHVRGLQKKLKDLEDRRKKIREQELLNNGTGNYNDHAENDPIERQKTPEHAKKTGVIQGVYKKAVAKRRKTRPLDEKNWGSDGAIDSSGVLEIAEALTESISNTSHKDGDQMSEQGPPPPNIDYGDGLSDDEEPHVTADDLDYVSDRADSISNLSEPVQESITKLKEDYLKLFAEVEELRKAHNEAIHKFDSNIEKQHDLFVDAMQDTQLRIRQIDDRVDDKLDKFSYSSEERVKDIEERLDDYRIKMTRFEKLQEQNAEGPISVADFPTRVRDVMSSIISLGLAMVSFFLFVFTTAVDCLKIFSENNILSTALSLGLFAIVIATYYYYFEVGRTVDT